MATAIQEKKFGKAFDLMDVDGSGVVTSQDAEAIARRKIEQAGLSIDAPQMRDLRDALTAYWRALDTNGNGQLTRDEYIESVSRLAQDPQRLESILTPGNRALISAFDTDGDGRISRSEYEQMEQESGLTPEDRERAWQVLDRDNSGYVTLDELNQANIDFFVNDDHGQGANEMLGRI
ncbi:EF-hand domain-containing protein [Streptomyces sp. NPDC002779]|uniref:EF-hand domain-containing protein n=1 Tax=Streptomyces sp. NPDC002779 TaxID=3364664 RepID=UPI0036C90C80